MSMFEPSLFLLLVKVVLVLGLSWLAGWALTSRKAQKDPLLQTYFETVSGIAILNLGPALASIWGGTAQLGVLLVGVMIIAKVLLSLRKADSFQSIIRVISQKKFWIIFLFTLGSSLNYLAPFIARGSSGYYSRGGGDHSTYLNLSSWYLENRFWKTIQEEKTKPPQPYWELELFTKARQEFCPTCVQPLANQFVASSYMALFPGYHEESYTAVVAVYLAVAGWGVVLLLSQLFQISSPWFFLAGFPVFFSNSLIHIATMHSIPFLLALSFLSATLLWYLNVIREKNFKFKISAQTPLWVIHTALFAVYPHLYVVSFVMIGVLVFSLCPRSMFRKIASLQLKSFLVSVSILNIYLAINIPLVYQGASSASGMSRATDWSNLIAAWSGLADFPTLNAKSVQFKYWGQVGWAGFATALFFISVLMKKSSRKECLVFISWVGMFVIAATFYNYRSFSWQMVRFTQMGHLFLLGGMGLGIIKSLQSRSLWLRRGAVLSLIFFGVALSAGRGVALKDVLSGHSTELTEYRDSAQLQMVKRLQAEQQKDPSSSRLVYYSGPGYGVDHAGASVLLRSVSYLAAQGYDYDPGIHLWDDRWLRDSLWVVNPPSEPEILQDDRLEAQGAAKWKYSSLSVFDTRSQATSQLLGPAWNAPQALLGQGEVRSMRYLKGNPGALVIWSLKDERIKIRVLARATEGDTKLRIQNLALNQELQKPISIWDGTFKPGDGIDFPTELRKGPNTVLFTPVTDQEKNSWVIFFKMQILTRQ